MLLFLAILFFLLLVVVHEYGHFLVAKRNGVEVEEFGIGFPPKIVGKTLGRGIFRSYYTINWLPLGGFVRLKGENDAATEKGTFGAASFWVKTKIILAGVAMNFIAAILIFTILAFSGMPNLPLIENQYARTQGQTVVRDETVAAVIDENTPAERAGLLRGDVLVRIGDDDVVDGDGLFDITQKYAGQTVPVTFERGGQLQTADVAFASIRPVYVAEVSQGSAASNLRAEDEILTANGQTIPDLAAFARMIETTPTQEYELQILRGAEEITVTTSLENVRLVAGGFFGVGPFDVLIHRYDVLNAPLVGIGTTLQLTQLTYEGLASLFGNLFTANFSKASENVSGPVGVVVTLNSVTILGFSFILFFIGVISLTLAIMNALPIPALDGGRLFVSGLFKVLKKPLNKELEQRIHGTGFAVLMGLILLITIVDIRRFF